MRLNELLDSQPITKMSIPARIRDIAAALVHEAAIADRPGQVNRLENMARDLRGIADQISLGASDD